jgi:hypothetical protein
VSWTITVVIDACDNADDSLAGYYLLGRTLRHGYFSSPVQRGLLSVSVYYCYYLKESIADYYIGFLALRGIMQLRFLSGHRKPWFVVGGFNENNEMALAHWSARSIS